jgi:hypothetical protein
MVVSYRNSLDRHASLAMTKSPVIASEAWQPKSELKPNMTDLQARHDAT